MGKALTWALRVGSLFTMPGGGRAAEAGLLADKMPSLAVGALLLAVGVFVFLWLKSRAALAEARERLEEAALMHEVLAGASVLVWSADVSAGADGRLKWRTTVRTESRGSRMLGLAQASGADGPWSLASTPDHEEIRRIATEAIESGAPGYHHEFRARTEDGLAWLHEETVIHRLKPRAWRLFGVITDITEHHRIEEEARRAAAQVKSFLERADCLIWHASVSMESGVWTWDFDVPPSGMRKRIFGEVDIVRTRRFYAGYRVPALEENNRRSQSAMLSGASGYEQEFEIIRVADGQIFWIQEQVSIVSDGPLRWQLGGVMLDVTSRHQADDARRDKEAQLNRILMDLECMLWLANVTREESGAFTWRFVLPDSLLYRKLFGCDPSVKGDALWCDQNVPDIAAMDERSTGALLTGAPGYAQEFCFFSTSGVHWLHEQVAIRPTGSNAWQAVGVVTDITERRTAERELASEKERLAVTLRAMEEGVITLGLDGAVLYINRAAEQLFAVSSEEVHGSPVTKVCRLVDSASGDELEWPVRPVLRDGAVADLPSGAAIHTERRRPVDVEGCVMPLRDSQGVVLGAVVVLRDVTDRRRLEAQLQRASKLESVGLLAGGIAHDFNNILTAIMGNLGLARMETEAGSAGESFIMEAHHAAERARGLTQQLLTFAKGGEPVRSTVPLPDLVTETAEYAVRGSAVRCRFDLAAGLWPANADRGQLTQIIQNLVVNAVQAMPEGGLVTLSATNEVVGIGSPLPIGPGDYVRIVIEDTGSGIAPENLGRIFEPYFTTKAKSSGLGLAAVYSIIRRHRGCIDVESEQGRGAKFVLRLPAVRGDRPAAGEAQVAPTPKLRGRVLVMDDEEPIRTLIAHLLRRVGLEVALTATGSEAVAYYHEAWKEGRPPQVLVMDLTVPGDMGGAQALDAIRKINPDVRAIVASGYSSDPIVANFKDYGFCARVLKPFNIQQLIGVIMEVLGGSEGPKDGGTPS